MQINEVCKLTGLTKKAVAYYEQQKLIKPHIAQNGYRDFSQSDVVRLKEISLLRKLDLSGREIKQVLDSNDKQQVLRRCRRKKEEQLKKVELQTAYIDRLIQHYDIEIIDELDRAIHNTLIKDKLTTAFPGPFGTMLVKHFEPFLEEEIETEEQQTAYEAILEYLDNLQLHLPFFLRLSYRYLERKKISISTQEDPLQRLLQEDESELQALKQSILKTLEERKKLIWRLNPFQHASRKLRGELAQKGYYDIFLPNLKLLSKSYREYQEKLLAINDRICRELGISYDEKWRVVQDNHQTEV